jgi:hypothetical protein
MLKPGVVIVSACCLLLPAVGLSGCGDLVLSSPDAGGGSQSGSSTTSSRDAGKRDAGKRDAGTKRDASKSDGEDDGTAADGETSGAPPPSEDDPAANDVSEADMGDAGEEAKPAGEVFTTESGTKIYLDPTCEGTSAMMSGMWLEFVGCCLESGTCGVSNHKIMLPPVIAAMFPVQCSGYEMLAGLGATIPETKSCTIPD